MARRMEQNGLPRELPVMASLVESGLRNLAPGDTDSAGYFQMRMPIWNTGPYAGYPENPELQVKWFLDQALAAKRRAVSAGRSDYGASPSQYGEWVADIQRPPASTAAATSCAMTRPAASRHSGASRPRAHRRPRASRTSSTCRRPPSGCPRRGCSTGYAKGGEGHCALRRALPRALRAELLAARRV